MRYVVQLALMRTLCKNMVCCHIHIFVSLIDLSNILLFYSVCMRTVALTSGRVLYSATPDDESIAHIHAWTIDAEPIGRMTRSGLRSGPSAKRAPDIVHPAPENVMGSFLCFSVAYV